AWRRRARRYRARGGASLPLNGRPAGAVAVARGAGRGLVFVAGAARPRARAGEPVLARAVLSADARPVQLLRGVAGRAGARAAARGGAAVAPRDRAALVDRVSGGGSRARGPVPGTLFRSRHRAPCRGGEPARAHRLVDLVAARGGGGRDGAGVLGGGLGARHGGAARRPVDAPGRLRVGRARGARRPVAVAALRRLARVVHVRLAPGARGRGGAG